MVLNKILARTIAAVSLTSACSLCLASSSPLVIFDDLLTSADAVFVADIESIESHIIGNVENPAITISDIEIFSTISLNRVYSISGLLGDAVDVKATIYIDGGKVPMPPGMSEKYPGSVLGEMNTSVPEFSEEGGSTYLWIVCQNGTADSPFCGSPHGVLKLSDDGTVKTVSGEVVSAISQGRLQFQAKSYRQDKPIESHGPNPPPGFVNPYAELLTSESYITRYELLDYVSIHRSKSDYMDLSDVLNPSIVANPSFAKIRK